MKLLDKLKKYLKNNKKSLTFLMIIFLIGIISGSIFSVTLKESDNLLVKNYLDNFLVSIFDNNLIYFDSFISTLISNIIILICIWLFGISIIGLPIILIIFFYKSFILGFTLGSILLNYKVKGILLSVIYIFPHLIIDIFMLITFCIIAINISKKILSALLKKSEVSFKTISSNYLISLLICIGITLITSLYSSYLVPNIIKLIPLFK